MILTEYEAKQLLALENCTVPRGVLIDLVDPLDTVFKNLKLPYPMMVKAQVLHGNRAQQGLILEAHDELELRTHVATLRGSQDQFGSSITQIVVEEKMELTECVYLALQYDTRMRSLVAQYSQSGGVGMDERGETVQSVTLSVETPPEVFVLQPTLLPVVQKLWAVCTTHDAVLVEVNPLALVAGQWVCLDAKIELEDAAQFRHPEWQQYSARSALGRAPTQREEQAHAVSRSDHRGVAGESFFEFPGGAVGIMASGGGASTLVMDALLAEGVAPANYTEYSGNPTREKVAALTDVVLSIPNLTGLFVVGSNANFTDIYETLAGVVDGLLNSEYSHNPTFVVFVRRGGPRLEEAFAMVADRLRDRQCVIELHGPEFPLAQTARAFKELLKKKL
jgi:succinyl-CoA synthetase beta subunit